MKLLSVTQNLRLPSICILCNQFHQERFALCSFCSSLLRPLGVRCIHCAYPLPEPNPLSCGRCIKKPPHFDNAFIAYSFEEPLRGLIHQFKYQNGLYLASFLCDLMKKALCSPTQAQCIIPVPLHSVRIKQRGFNQAAVLAKLLAKHLGLPYIRNACKKMINTPPQASLNAKQRQKNLQQAFQIDSLPYDHIMLIDDLLTTGSTANELAFCFKLSGIKTVDICCCARTIY